MPQEPIADPASCNCLAVRQAARHITQFYDQYLAAVGLRTTQYGVLARIRRHGPMSMNALAAQLVMDRTTLGRNIRPLERDGLIVAKADPADRRSKILHLTKPGHARYESAYKRWVEAQREFERVYGGKEAVELRQRLRAVVSSGRGPLAAEEAT